VILHTLALRDFRNIEAAELEWSPSLTLLVGDNGQGKTNVLEAAALVAAQHPTRARAERELARFGTEGYRLQATYLTDAGETVRSSRSVWLRPPRRRVEGPTLPVVTFTPDDLSLVKAGPEERRDFLDRLLMQLKPRYRSELGRYQRAVGQRNRALKDDRPDAVLEGFEPLLADAGAYCWAQRQWLCSLLGPEVVRVYAELVDKEQPSLALDFGGSGAMLTPEAFREALERGRTLDRRRGATGVGPHRDDLVLRVSGTDGRLLSQGQQRTLVLALKLAARSVLEHELGSRPLLVLDDVFSELDGLRRAALLRTVGAPGQQTAVADVDGRAFLPLAGRCYRLVQGRVEEASPTT
jgi:DNA replication and repair protein RecF